MLEAIQRKEPSALAAVLNQAGVLISVLDLEGRLLYYSENVPPLVTRDESLLGQDVRQCHQSDASNLKIDAILTGYKRGKSGTHHWVLEREGKSFAVKVTPLIENSEVKGLIHTLMMLA